MNRRRLLWCIAAALPFAASAQKKGKVLVTGGHPGDPEYACGGTVAKLSRLGYDVTLLYLNRGEKGCKTDANACAATRTAEAEQACRILGATPLFFNQIDGEAAVNNETYARFRELIAPLSPELILSHWPVDNHRDHRAIAMLTYDAWRRMKANCSLYYYEVTDGEDTMMFSPTDYVDITTEEAFKRKACYAHASQAPDHFYQVQSDITKFRGSQVGCAQAEAFTRQADSRPHPALSARAS